MTHMIGPASAPPWVLLGVIKKDLGEFQRFGLLWVVAGCFVFIIAQLVTGAMTVNL